MKKKPLKKQLRCLTFKNGGMASGYEALFAHGEYVGYVTSATCLAGFEVGVGKGCATGKANGRS